MKKRRIGPLEVSEIGLGCMGITHASGAPLSEEEGVRVLRDAFDMGYTFFDTAECYTGMRADGTVAYNEDVVGEALRPMRDKVVIATKCGVRITDDGLVTDSRPETIRASVEKSLRRLRTDRIDLYYQHRIDPKIEPESVAETMGKLIQEGKILAWGISEAEEEYLRRANAVTPVSAIQNRFSMMARWHESLFPVLEELGIAYVAFSPMANGFLTAQYTVNTRFEPGTDYRGSMPQYTEEGFEKARPLLEMLERIAKEKNATPAQISLAWVLAQGSFMIPIPGSRKSKRLRENLEAADVELAKEDIEKINALLDTVRIPVFGGMRVES